MALLEPSTVHDADERARANAPRPGRWSVAAPLAAALATLLHAPRAHAEEVTLTRDPPFDRVCLAPICKTPGAPQPIRPPLALPLGGAGAGSGSREVGLLEAQLRKTITDAVQASLADVHTSWNHRATRDVLRAIAAIVAKDESALARSKGLGAAALRAALVVKASDAVAPDARCTAAARLDAIYEGIALSPLGALEFTEATGRVDASCVETAKRAERVLARAVLVPLARGAGPIVAAADGAVRDVRARCDAKAPGLEDASLGALSTVAELPESPTLAQLAKSIARVRLSKDALARDAAKVSELCGRAVAVAVSIDDDALDRLAEAGLAAAEARAIVEELRQAEAACTGDASSCDAQKLLAAVLTQMVGGGAPTREQLALLLRALVLAVVPPGEDPGVALAAIRALEGAIVSVGAGSSLDPDAILADIEKRYELRDGKPTLRTLLGLGPSPWVFELNGGLPKLDGNDIRFVADGAFGYESTTIGVVVRGGVRYFDFVSPVLSTQNTDAQGWLESWLVTGDARSSVRFEGRLTGGTEYVDTTTLNRPASLGGRTTVGDYDSLLIRAALLFGVRVRAGERLGLSLLGGGGYQYETFDTTSVPPSGFSFRSPDASSGQGNARFDVRWKIAPSILSARGSAEGQYFSLTREELSSFTDAVGANQTSLTLTTQVQLFVRARAFVDADVLSFGGFVPALWAGADYTYLEAPQGERSTTVPVFGVGIVRPRL